jgi:recombination protein RecT
MTTHTAPMTTESGQIVPHAQTKDTIERWLANPETQARLKAMLPAVVKPERFTQVALTALARNRALLSCTPSSLLRCMVQAAMVGLELDTGLGHAYLIPFRDRKSGTSICTLILGYRGLVQLIHRSAAASSIAAHVVRKGDEFAYEFGLEPKLVHRPAPELPDEATPGAAITHAYAVLTLRDGRKQFDVMTRKEIDAVRARSRASTEGPWVTDYPEMAKKTVLRRLAKLAPMSVEDQRVVMADELADAGQSQAAAFDPGISLPELGDEVEAPVARVDAPDTRTSVAQATPPSNGHPEADTGTPEPLPQDPLTPRDIQAGAAGATHPFIAALQIKLAEERLWPVPLALAFGEWRGHRAFMEMARAGWTEASIVEAFRAAQGKP